MKTNDVQKVERNDVKKIKYDNIQYLMKQYECQ